MPDENIPTLRRKPSSSTTSGIDPFNEAEKGLRSNPPAVPNATRPPGPRNSASFPFSLRSSGSTLVDSPGEFQDIDPSRAEQSQNPSSRFAPSALFN